MYAALVFNVEISFGKLIIDWTNTSRIRESSRKIKTSHRFRNRRFLPNSGACPIRRRNKDSRMGLFEFNLREFRIGIEERSTCGACSLAGDL
ncbi:hypothetical protein TNCT_175111 [Trichonephila clavata]|uniref:Uncharacterized protein n=1 Tax=Trichonephila clavata TaxID=2740835 RepID=A0A8X6F4K2_TRICU|nr:hypothetical protein TNCT_175111 [Trichonephila clavata]